MTISIVGSLLPIDGIESCAIGITEELIVVLTAEEIEVAVLHYDGLAVARLPIGRHGQVSGISRLKEESLGSRLGYVGETAIRRDAAKTQELVGILHDGCAGDRRMPVATGGEIDEAEASIHHLHRPIGGEHRSLTVKAAVDEGMLPTPRRGKDNSGKIAHGERCRHCLQPTDLLRKNIQIAYLHIIILVGADPHLVSETEQCSADGVAAGGKQSGSPMGSVGRKIECAVLQVAELLAQTIHHYLPHLHISRQAAYGC